MMTAIIMTSEPYFRIVVESVQPEPMEIATEGIAGGAANAYPPIIPMMQHTAAAEMELPMERHTGMAMLVTTVIVTIFEERFVCTAVHSVKRMTRASGAIPDVTGDMTDARYEFSSTPSAVMADPSASVPAHMINAG